MTPNADDTSGFVSRCRELCHEHVKEEERYAADRLEENARRERDAEKKEEREAAPLMEQCLQSLQAIVNARSNRGPVEEVVMPAVEGIPKYKAWIPVKDDVLFYDQEDSLFRLPQVQDDDDVATKSRLAKEENFMEKFEEAWTSYEYEVGEIDARVKTAQEEYYNLRIGPKSKQLLSLDEVRKEKACCWVMRHLRYEGYPLEDEAAKRHLAEAFEVSENQVSSLYNRAVREAKEYFEMLERRKSRQEFRATFSRGVADSKEEDLKSGSLSEAVCASEGLVDEAWKNFCFVCHEFCCEKHNLDWNQRPVIPIKDVSTSNRLAKLADGPVPCSRRCFSLPFNDSRRGEVLPSEETRWTNEEISMLSVSAPVFHNDPCSLADVIGSRTCREVFALLQEPRWKKWMEETIAYSEQPREVEGSNLDELREDIEQDADTVDSVINIPCNHEDECTEENCPCVARDAICTNLCCCANSRFVPGQEGTGIALSVPQKWEGDEVGLCLNMERPCECEPGGCRDGSCGCWARLKACDSLCGCQRNSHICNPLVTKKCVCEPGNCVSPPCGFIPFLMKKKKRVIPGKSPVHGYGLYAGEFIAAREFIGMYSGLLLYSHYSELLGFEFDANDHTFLFDTTRMHTIDATILGSTLKFINHQSAESPKMNCVSKKQFHRGHPSVAYFASRDIQPGEELFIDYLIKDQRPEWMGDSSGDSSGD